VHLLLPLDQLPKPNDALIVGAGPLFALFVFPMRGDSLLGEPVTEVCSD